MGNILKIATQANAEKGTITAFPTEISPKEKRERMAEIYQGFLEGTGVGTFNFTNLLLCIYEADQSAIALYEGVNLLEQAWASKDWENAIGGAMFIFTGVESFMQQGLQVCESIDMTGKDMTKFNKIVDLTKDK